MRKIITTRVNHTLYLAACLPLLHACSGIGAISGDMPLKVESDPTGATVFIMDKPVGETPITISQQQIYPAGYDPTNQKLYGSLAIKKTGCQDFNKRIRYQDFNQTLTAKLQCGETPNHQSLQPTLSDRVISTPIDTPTSSSNHTPATSMSERMPKTTATQRTAPEQSAEVEKAKGNEEQRSFTIKQRLQRLDDLKHEGLITEEEYQQVRRNILDEL
ncbi:MAG: PEGA domain-containing protein [Candidatus Thiodiazotropha sp.]|nr:PEGA domain-containing protein [Candidatus Thiodiazotropha sp.]MCM8921694.1 PEGA domain-containing protein [Candidatus Thiodiazotropha sp.]